MNMKKYNSKIPFKKHLLAIMVMIVSVAGIFSSCSSDIVGDNLYTFTDKMMGQYLRDSADYSQFTALLDTTKVMGLLNAYGQYTCFAPSNQAMRNFYVSKGKKSLKDFSLDSLKIIAYDHIIMGTTVMYSNFITGRLPQLSMSDRYFSISFSSTGIAYINKTSEVIKKDILVHNGVIHKINQVLNPTRDGIVDAVSKDSTFTLFYNALIATGLADSLLKVKDASYDPLQYADLITQPKGLNLTLWYYNDVPQSRKYGYTLLMESNATMNLNGITDMASMKAYAARIYNEMYPADAGITDVYNRHNSLNRFIAYHIINKQLSYTKFIDAYDTDHMLKTQNMYEYLEPMCPNTLIEIKKDRLMDQTIFLINNKSESNTYIKINKANYDNDATNGVFHEIDGMLVYDKNEDAELSSKRLRFDAASFFPEFTNNNMRGIGLTDPNLQYRLPRGYVDRITSSEQTVVSYLTPYRQYQDYEGDEIFIGATTGNLYDFSVVTPPVPAGTYEVRFGYLTNGRRGVVQLYLDNVPAGVPFDLNTNATDPLIGYETPGSMPADPFGYENDKMMRNRGYMKGPACFKVPVVTTWSSGQNARYSNQLLRKILGTYTFTTAGNHVLGVKGLSGGEFMMDYLEFIPTSALESEDVN